MNVAFHLKEGIYYAITEMNDCTGKKSVYKHVIVMNIAATVYWCQRQMQVFYLVYSKICNIWSEMIL